MKTTTLYRIDNTNSLQVWEITNNHDHLVLNYGKLGGKLQFKTVPVTLNQSGRDMEEQALLEYNSRINKQLADGYCNTIEEAEANKGLNELNTLRPMLAKTFEKSFNGKMSDYYAQLKLDGHRCMITKKNGKTFAYSRNGKLITTIDHIIEAIHPSLFEGMTLDGELYHHGTPVWEIGSWVRRKQDNTERLKYICFDLVSQSNTFERNMALSNVVDNGDVRLGILPLYDLVKTDLDNLMAAARNDGYEGLMLRHKRAGYEVGKRSGGLLKVKEWHDEEYLVVNITASSDGTAILHCENLITPTFTVTAPGTVSEKQLVLDHADLFIGKYVNVQYACLTDKGIPFHPVAKYWRQQ